MTISQSGTWQVAIKMAVAGSGTYVNVFRVLAPHPADAEVVAADCANAYADDDAFADVQSDQLTYESVTVQSLDGSSAGVVFGPSAFPNDNGSVTAPIISPQTAGLVTKRSLVGGPRGRGRLFIPGLTTLSLSTTKTTLDDTTLAQFQASASKFLELLEGGDLTTGMALPNLDASDPITVSELVARRYLGTQRRRAEQYA